MRIIAALLLLSCATSFAQMTKEERKAERERVKAEQKLLDQQAKEQKKHLKDQAKNAPAWTIVDAKPEDIKGFLITLFRGYGYSIENESEHQITFWRELTGAEAIGPTIALGNAHSENPKRHEQFTLTADESGKTRVDADCFVTVRMPFGQENRADMTNNIKFKEGLVGDYAALQSWADHRKSAAAQQSAAK